MHVLNDLYVLHTYCMYMYMYMYMHAKCTNIIINFYQSLSTHHFSIPIFFLTIIQLPSTHTLIPRVLFLLLLFLFLISEKDWDDMKHMPEYSQLMKDFGRQKSS